MPLPETPRVTVDIVIELLDQPGRPIVLIERRNPPHGWALPGGFVDVGETLEHAAVREAREETQLAVELDVLLGCYSDPGRDARMHTVSVVYIAHAHGEPVADDDAVGIRLLGADSDLAQLVFDHARIIADYRNFRFHGISPALNSVADAVS